MVKKMGPGAVETRMGPEGAEALASAAPDDGQMPFLIAAIGQRLARASKHRVTVASATSRHLAGIADWPPLVEIAALVLPEDEHSPEGGALAGVARGGILHSAAHDWDLPRATGTLVWVGLMRSLSIRMLIRALRAGYFKITGVERGQIITRSVVGMLLQRGLSRIARNPKEFRAVSQAVDAARKIPKPLRSLPAGSAVLMITGSLGPGGAERQLVNTAISLKQRGFAVTVLRIQDARSGVSQADFYRPTLEEAGVTIAALEDVPAPPFDHFIVSGVAASIAFAANERAGESYSNHFEASIIDIMPDNILFEAFKILKFLRQNDFAVVHTWQDTVNMSGGLAATLHKRPRLVMGTRNVRPTYFAYHWPAMAAIYQMLLARPDVAILNNSRAAAADYADWLGLPYERLAVVHNGVAPSTSVQLVGLSGGSGPVIGSVFRFHPEKRPLLWVETARLVHAERPDARFVLVGDGPMRNEIGGAVQAADLTTAFLFQDPTPQIAEIMQTFSVFLLTSAHEGLPNVLIEAQILGVPVVTTDAGGAAETLISPRLGRLVKPARPDALAAEILDLLRSPPDVRMREQSAKEALRAFSTEAMVDRTLEVYSTTA